MDKEKNYEEITCKVVMYSRYTGEVLVFEYTGGEGYGLPGGHLEMGEEPVDACKRELHEEIGLDINIESLQIKRSWRHLNGKIIIGYAAVIPRDSIFEIKDNREIKAIHWIKIEDIQNDRIYVGTYKQFILESVPDDNN